MIYRYFRHSKHHQRRQQQLAYSQLTSRQSLAAAHRLCWSGLGHCAAQSLLLLRALSGWIGPRGVPAQLGYCFPDRSVTAPARSRLRATAGDNSFNVSSSIISSFIIKVVIRNFHVHIILVHCCLYYKHKFNSVIYWKQVICVLFKCLPRSGTPKATVTGCANCRSAGRKKIMR